MKEYSWQRKRLYLLFLKEPYNGAISRYQNHLSELEHDFSSHSDTTTLLDTKIEAAKKKLGEQEDTLSVAHVESLQRQLDRITQEMEQKEQSVAKLFTTVHTAELELEDKEAEYFALIDQLKGYKAKLKQHEHEVKKMEKEKTRYTSHHC